MINKLNKFLLFVLCFTIVTASYAADNLNVTQGVGTIVAADEVTRNAIVEKEQIVKIGLGVDGTHDGFARMGQQTKANSLAVTLPSDQDGIATTGSAVPTKGHFAQGTDGTNARGLLTDSGGRLQNNIAQVGGTATDTNSGSKSAGTLRVVIATDQPQLTNALKVDGSAVTQPVSGTVTATFAANTTGGYTPVPVTITNAAQALKSSAVGTLGGWTCYNPNSVAVFVQVFNIATAGAVTVGSSTALTIIAIPAFGPNNLAIPSAFSAGIQIAATTTRAGSTAPTTNVECTFYVN